MRTAKPACAAVMRKRWSTCLSLHPLRSPHTINHRRLIHSHLPCFASPPHAAAAIAPSITVPPPSPPSSPASSAPSRSPPPSRASPFLSITCPPVPSPTSGTTSPNATAPRSRVPIALPSAETFSTSVKYCLDYVKRHDSTGYLTTLFAPESIRPALLVLRAFFLEVSRIPLTTSDPRVAEIKLAWWQSTIKSIYASPSTPPPAQPIVQLLHFLVHRHSLTQRLLSRIVQAKTADLDEQHTFSTITDLDAYHEATHSSLYYLFLKCLPSTPSLHSDHLASHVGKAVGLTRLLQSLPYHASHRRCRIPSSVLQHCGVEVETVYGMESTAGLQQAVFELASNAKAHVVHGREVRGMGSGVKGEEVRVLLDVVECERWLDELERVNFDVFDKTLYEREKKGWEPLKLRYALWKHSRKGTF